MTGSTVISIDAMGGDRGPAAVLGGLQRALRKLPDLRFLVHGDEAQIGRLLAKRGLASIRERVEVRHAADTVRMTDKPSRALRERRGSSMWAALEAVKRGEAKVAVSSGNTGALLAMSVLILRKAPGIDRPAIAVHWPSTAPHGYNTVLDVGADLRADPRALVQFAVMGAEYARVSFGIERPRIGFLNVGTEETKGTVEVQRASEIVARAAQETPGLFEACGFVEGHHISSDRIDVVVTDGFTGNIALKTAEGTAAFIRQGLKDAFGHSVWSYIGTLFAITSLRRFQKRIDPRRVNGGVFLGLNGAVVKSHGSADAIGFEAAVRLAANLAESDFAERVTRQLGHIDLSELPHGHAPDGGGLARAVVDAPSSPDTPSPDTPTPDTSTPGTDAVTDGTGKAS